MIECEEECALYYKLYITVNNSHTSHKTSKKGGIGAPRTPKDCDAASLKLEMAAEESHKLDELLTQLGGESEKGGVREEGEQGNKQPSSESVAATQMVVASLQVRVVVSAEQCVSV